MKRSLWIVLVAVFLGCQQQPSDNPSEAKQADEPRKELHVGPRPAPPTITFQRALFSAATPKRLVLTVFEVERGIGGPEPPWKQQLELWEVGSGKYLWGQQQKLAVEPLAFLDDNAKLLVKNGDALEIWDTATGKALRQLTSANVDGQILDCLSTADGRKVLVGRKKSVCAEPYSMEVWDVFAGKRLSQVNVRTQRFYKANTWSTDGKMLAGLLYSPEVGFNAFTLLDVATGKELRGVDRPKEGWDMGGGGWLIAFSPDCRLAATLQSKTVKSEDNAPSRLEHTLVVWEVDGRKEVASLPLGTHLRPEATEAIYLQPRAVIFSGDNRQLLVGTDEGIVQVWDLSRKEITRTFSAGPDEKVVIKPPALNYFFSNDLKLVLVGGGRVSGGQPQLYLTVWDVASEKLLRNLTR